MTEQRRKPTKNVLVALVAGTRPQIIHGVNMLIRQTRHRQIATKYPQQKKVLI